MPRGDTCGQFEQLVLTAILTLDEDVRVAGRHALVQLEEFLHLLALADDVREAVLAANLLLELLVLGPLGNSFGVGTGDFDTAVAALRDDARIAIVTRRSAQ